MARIYLIRHGKAGATWNDHDPDPGLTELGRNQAEAVAASLAGQGPLPILTSPLRRTRETAAAFERAWGVRAAVEPRVGEIPAPKTTLHRVDWLKWVLGRHWRELDTPLQRWRAQVLDAILAISQNTVVISHYVAINVIVGQANGDDQVSSFRPENCSCTTVENGAGSLSIVELGVQGASRIF